MWLLFLGLAIVFLIILLFSAISKSPEDIADEKEAILSKVKERQTNGMSEATNDIEGDSRMRILSESMDLIMKTENLETLISRIVDVDEQLQWCADQINSGRPIRLSINAYGIPLSYDNFNSNVDEIYKIINDEIVRVAMIEFDKWKDLKIRNGKRFTESTSKLFDKIDTLIGNLKDCPNQVQSNFTMQGIRTQIEESYANIG